MSLSVSGKGRSVDNLIGDFFKQARRSGLWPEAQGVHRSAVTKARRKLPWQLFEQLFYKAVRLAYQAWPDDPQYQWHGMSVFAIDGSKYALPATAQIRDVFDSNSGLDSSTQRHYPQCLVSTAFDVFRRLPVARTIVGIETGNEREEAKRLIEQIPPNQVLLFDRGYPSYELIGYLNLHYSGYYVFRCAASNTFPAVEAFLDSQQKEAVISISPSRKFLARATQEERQQCQPLRLRAIRLVAPDGTVSVLLSNLFQTQEITGEEIIELYFKRWAVEEQYRDEKIVMGLEQFHARTPNGIQQELFSVLVMSVITRTLMAMSSRYISGRAVAPQFKHAVLTLASDAGVLAANDPDKALEVLSEILTEIERVLYYRPKKPRSASPRVSKKPPNKWREAKKQKIRAA